MSSSQAARAPRHRRARRLRRTTTNPISMAPSTAAPSSQAMSLTSSVLTLWRARIKLPVEIGVTTARHDQRAEGPARIAGYLAEFCVLEPPLDIPFAKPLPGRAPLARAALLEAQTECR